MNKIVALCIFLHFSVNAAAQSDVTLTFTNNLGGVEVGRTVDAYQGTVKTSVSGTTDSNGQVTLSLDPGDYRFRILVNGEKIFTDSVNHCSTPSCTSVDYEVKYVTLNVTNNLGGMESGLPVVAYKNGSQWTEYGGTTDSNGAVTFPIPDGIYSLRISKSGFQLETPLCDTASCSSIDYEIGLITLNLTNNLGQVEPNIQLLRARMGPPGRLLVGLLTPMAL